MSAKGSPFKVFKATLQQHLLYMNRFATIVYPKDIASIMMHGDIRKGHKVLEGGFGSGALSLSLLLAIGDQGELTTYELRDQAINCGKRNIEAFLGPVSNHTVEQRDVYEGID